MGSQRSKEDEVHKISTSVFVTNFPDQSCAKDLWNACKQYGYVVDEFIPNRRSKAGKRLVDIEFMIELKNQNHGNQAEGTGARGMVYAFGGGETEQDINNIEDEIEA
ncbi:nucleotide-binding alpha-beta plait domain-containing protein [Tanacetum coccineum]